MSRAPTIFKHVCVALFAALVSLTSFGTEPEASADSTKAAFLHRFAAYIEWPDDASAEGPFVIGVAGDEGVVKQLESLLPGVTVRGRPTTVRRVNRIADLAGLHLLFVGAGEFKNTRALRAAALEQPILIVTDDEGGLDGGAVINFLETNDTVKFEISLIAADRARLKVDAALLAVAARVERRPQLAGE